MNKNKEIGGNVNKVYVYELKPYGYKLIKKFYQGTQIGIWNLCVTVLLPHKLFD